MTSPFAIRGVIEGFYGVPWTHAQRLDMIDEISALGMNTFVYAPKDDPFLRRDWRLPYDDAALGLVAELVTRCRDRGITLMFALSPGLSMRYSDADDLAMLQAKYAQVAGLGVAAFALLLDDIPAELQHPGDLATYPTLVAAQIELIGRLHAVLPGSLTVAPTQYWGRGDEAYITQFGRGIDPAVDIFWTGRAICSPRLEVVDAARFVDATGHRPLYWDNFPVNDVAMTHEMHLGPYQGRDAGLADWSRGVIANAMPAAESSKIAFASIAAYLADPLTFEPEAAWEMAIERVAGPDAATVRRFADALRGSALCTDDSPRLGDVLTRFAFDHDFGDPAAAVAELAEQARLLGVTAHDMRGIANAALVAEVDPWIEQYARAADALVLCADLLTAGPVDAAGRAAVMARLTELRAHRLRVHGDLVDMFLSDVAHEFERG